MAASDRVWILCPNLWGARLFFYGPVDTEEKQLRFVREFPRPKQRTKLEDFADDLDGDDALGQVESPEFERRVAEEFIASVVIPEIQKASKSKEFEALILCAEPQMLEIVKSRLTPDLRRKIRGEIAQDLYEANETDLVNYLQDLPIAA